MTGSTDPAYARRAPDGWHGEWQEAASGSGVAIIFLCKQLGRNASAWRHASLHGGRNRNGR